MRRPWPTWGAIAPKGGKKNVKNDIGFVAFKIISENGHFH